MIRIRKLFHLAKKKNKLKNLSFCAQNFYSNTIVWNLNNLFSRIGMFWFPSIFKFYPKKKWNIFTHKHKTNAVSCLIHSAFLCFLVDLALLVTASSPVSKKDFQEPKNCSFKWFNVNPCKDKQICLDIHTTHALFSMKIHIIWVLFVSICSGNAWF